MNIFMIRRILSISIALLLSAGISFYLKLPEPVLVLTTTLLIMLVPVGVTLRKGLQRFLIITIIVLAGSFYSSDLIYLRMYDVVIGAAIGIIVGLIAFPIRPDKEFRKNMIIILQNYINYFNSIIDLMLRQKNNAEKPIVFTPSWVYESGFSHALQAGYRHFLVKSERLGQILFSMHHVARHDFDPQLLQEIQAPLMQCAEKINGFLNALITILELKKLDQGIVDFDHDLLELQNKFKEIAPLSLELLDRSKDNMYFLEFIYDLKDMRVILLSLAEALR